MKKILIADDKPDVRTLIRATLDMGEFEFCEAKDGSSALEVATSELPDLMLLDIMMPGTMDGFQVCQALKAQERTKEIIIILLTALGSTRDLERGKSAGADGHFVKPFSPKELLDCVYQALKM